MERRTFLRALTATPAGVMLGGSLAGTARAQTVAPGSALETARVEVSGNMVFVRRYGRGPAILMVHGCPRTSVMWRFLAPMLAEKHTVVCVDLRAYGRSGVPSSTDDHVPYSKRAMAKELVDLMVKLGFPTFTLIGHDRGGRVSYRLALDHPKRVERLAVFDVIPILEGSSTTGPTRRPRRRSNARCCTCGQREGRSTRSTKKTAVRWASGGSGLRTRTVAR